MFNDKQLLMWLLLPARSVMMNLFMIKSKKEWSHRGATAKSIREQMARSHLERTVTDFRQQWSLRPETFWKTTEGMQQHDWDLFLNLQYYYDLVLTPIVLLWFLTPVIRFFSEHFLHVTKNSRNPSIRSCSLSALSVLKKCPVES